MHITYRLALRPLLVLLILGAAPVTATGAAERRVALIIGNGAYENTPALSNPTNDAHAMAGMLHRAGFEVLEGVDLGRAAMEDLLTRFEERAHGADAAVAFYAGHAVQVDGRNYLLPVDARLEQKIDLRRQVPVDWLVEDAGRARRLALVILDACRDNPLAHSLRARERGANIGRGLAQAQDQPPTTLVADATAADKTAADGAGAHSPFTEALLEHLPTPGLEIGLALRKVRDTVIGRTAAKQQPFTYGSLGGEEFYLMPGAPQGGGDADANRMEVAFWESIRGGNDPRLYEEYLRRFPDGTFTGLARFQLDDLRAKIKPDDMPDTAEVGRKPNVSAPASARSESDRRRPGELQPGPEEGRGHALAR
jgi:hypothetical protein